MYVQSTGGTASTSLSKGKSAGTSKLRTTCIV